VLEKVIYKRVLTHINNHNILVIEQFGCRSRSSTEKASYNLIYEILKDSNNRRIDGCIFLEMEKTFDCLNIVFYYQNQNFIEK
jgi:hypothetical protein